MGRADEGVPSVRAALDLALSNGLTGPAAELYQRLADSLEHASDYRSAAQAYDSAYAFCEAHGDQATGLLCQACAAVVMFHSGRWNRAVRLCREVLDDEAARPHPRAAAAAVLGLVHALRGQAGPARAALLESRSTAARIELVAAEILALWGLAMAEDLAGNSDGAAEEYRRVVRRCEETEESHYCVPVLLFAAAHFAERSASKDLSAVTAVLARIAEATGQPEARAALAYALASGATADVALDHYRRALDLLSGLELPIVDSQIRWRTGVVLLATGDRVGGADSLRQAYRTLHRLGARPLADRIRATLGEPDADRPALRLTGRETQVLGLVADGHTSREIARRLYLSTRTVEMHVQNAMTKLGCRTRAEAVHLLGRATP
jgi:DNA-binding CsgD family transcriptional regulator